MRVTFDIRETEQELDSVAEILSEALKVKFVRRESSFRGGDYYHAEVQEGDIYLQGNRDELPDDDPFEPKWPIDQLILYLSGPDEQSWQKAVHALETTHRVGVVRLK